MKSQPVSIFVIQTFDHRAMEHVCNVYVLPYELNIARATTLAVLGTEGKMPKVVMESNQPPIDALKLVENNMSVGKRRAWKEKYEKARETMTIRDALLHTCALPRIKPRDGVS